MIARERMTGLKPPAGAERLTDLWRPYVEEKAGAELDKLADGTHETKARGPADKVVRQVKNMSDPELTKPSIVFVAHAEGTEVTLRVPGRAPVRVGEAVGVAMSPAAVHLFASASSIGLQRNTADAAPVTATRTPEPVCATSTPTSAKRDAGFGNFA